MKKLILLIAIALIAVSTGLSLEPTRVSVYAPQHRTIAEGGSGPAASVRVDLVNYDGGATTLYTGKIFGAGDPEVTADDNGVILVTVGGSTDANPNDPGNTFAQTWDAIDAANMNTSWSFDIYINGTLYSQGRIDQQIIIQANTSIFNSSGVLLPSGNPSTVGEDNNRFDAVYVKENEADLDLEGVYIGPTGGISSNQLALTYDNSTGTEKGIIAADGADIMHLTSTGIDFNGKILDNVATINDDNNPLTISGAVTADQPANSIGDGNDVTQLTIDGVVTTPGPPVNPSDFDLQVTGDAKVDGYLEVNGFSLLGNFNMNDFTIYNVREIIGKSGDGALLLNSTASANPVWTENGPITTGTGLFTINGNLDATLGVDVTNADLTVGATNFVVDDATGNTDIAGTLTVDGNSTIGDANTDEVFFNAEVSSNFVPVDGNRDLGLNTSHRWRSAYLNDVLHIGPDNGETTNTELAVNYGSDIANFNVNGKAEPQLRLDATTGTEQILLDPLGNGVNYTITEGYININNSANADLHISETQIMRTNASDQTLTFRNDNVSAVLNIDIEGKIDVQSAASTMGDGADATQLTVEGSVGGANDALVVQGSTDIDARLNVDGNTTLQEDVDLGSATDDAISFLGRVDTNVEPIANNAHALGSDALRWSALWVDGNAIHVGEVNGDNLAELEIGYLNDVATFTVDAGADAELAIDANNQVIELDPAGNASTNYSFAEAGVTIDNGGTSVVLSDGALTSSAPQEFEMIATGGNLDVLIDGKIDVQAAASTIGDGTDGLQLTVEGDVATGTVDFLVDGDTDINGTLNADGNTTFQEDVDLGSATDDLISFAGRVDTDIVPNVDNSHSLGSDALRWTDVYVNGGSVHVGNANGVTGNEELNIGWASNQATFNVDNATNAQFNIDAGNSNLEIDPAGDGTSTNFTFAEASATVNTAAGVDLIVTEGGLNRNDAAVQTFAFANSDVTAGANLNVTMDGDLDVAEQITGPNVGHSLGTATTDGTVLTIAGLENSGVDELVVDGDVQIDGTTNIDGVLTATAAANEIGDGADETQLTILGSTANVGSSELVVVGEADINGDLLVGQTATVVGIFDAQSAASTMGDGADALQLTIQGDDTGANDALVVEGHADIDGDFNVDGATTLNGTVALGDAAADEITVNGEFVSSLIPTAASTIDLGATGGQEWNDLHLANDANIGNNAVVENEIRLIETADATDYVGFVAPGDVTASQIWTLPVADGTADQQLITDGSGNLSWGSTSLQVAYEGGNEIITDAGDGDVIIRGTQELDIRVNIANDVAGNGAGITVDDDFTVVNGDISFGTGSQFTIVGSNGNTTTNGTLTTTGLVTANSGMNIFGANLTVGGSNFVVTPGGATTVEGILTANQGLTVNDANLVVGAANLFQVNEVNGNTTVGGILDQSTGTAMGDAANVLSISGTGATYSTASLNGTHPAGSVVHISFPDGANSVTDSRGTQGGLLGCTIVKDGNGNWYIVATY